MRAVYECTIYVKLLYQLPAISFNIPDISPKFVDYFETIRSTSCNIIGFSIIIILNLILVIGFVISFIGIIKFGIHVAVSVMISQPDIRFACNHMFDVGVVSR